MPDNPLDDFRDPADPADPTSDSGEARAEGTRRTRTRSDGTDGPTGEKRRMSGGKKALIGVLAVLLVIGGGGAGAVWWFQRSLMNNIESLGDPFQGLDARPTPTSDPTNLTSDPEAVNFLVLGSDSRISAGDPNQWSYGAQRTDTIMLVQIPADRQNIFVMSIPRDSWVPIPGYGEAKINAAFSYGGPPLLIQTVEDLTGVLVDHFVVTDFESFQRITDDLGGVVLNLKEDFTYDGVTIPAGSQQTLNGEQALRWVRERKSLPRGDFDRVQRQQAWMRAIAAKVRNSGVLTNPVQLSSLLTTISQSISADDALTADVLRSLLLDMRTLGTDDIVFFTAPFSGTGRSTDGQSIVELDQGTLDALMQAWRDDDLAAFLEANQGALDSLPAVVN